MPKTAEIRRIVIDRVQMLHKQQQHSKDDNVMDSASVEISSADSPECDAQQQTVPASSATSKTLPVEGEVGLAIIRSSACKPTRSTNNSQELMKVFRQEITLYENRGTRGRNLQLMYDYFTSVHPTSVEAERAFAAAGIICSRLRTRLGDETDSLCLLRSYIQKHTSSKQHAAYIMNNVNSSVRLLVDLVAALYQRGCIHNVTNSLTILSLWPSC